jgi:hypothetical protein
MRMKRIAVACVALALAVGAYTTAREAKEEGPRLRFVCGLNECARIP